MARRKRRGVWICTSTGLDGAAAAAMVLQVEREAEVLITSKNRCAETLQALQARAGAGSRIHVCGVGTGESLETIVTALGVLRDDDISVKWYCGRGYLDEAEPELSSACETRFEHCRSNTECVFRHLAPAPDALTDLLLQLAADFVEQGEDLPDDAKWWRDLIRAATTRAFQFEDDDALPAAIRALAGLREPTARDEREVARERTRDSLSLPLGRSPAMTRLRRLTARLAEVEEPVLILGPSGAGKEMVARSIHDASARADGPFVPVNCAILSASSEFAQDRLFGHTRGAFTGANQDQAGAFSVADGGTLFLDEVAELPVDVQTQLLRVLEEKRFAPIGTMTTETADVRIIAATNRDLGAMVRAGAFRMDLFYRLNVLSVSVPPLSERREDLPTLADAVRHRLSEAGHELSLSDTDWEAIRGYAWPGNIRQFQNVLKRAAYMHLSVAEAIREERLHGLDAPGKGDAPPPENASGGASRSGPALLLPSETEEIRPFDEVRRSYMRHCLALCEGNHTEASRRLNISANTLRKYTRD